MNGHRDDSPDRRLTCRQAIDLFGSYLAGELGPARRRLFVSHVRRCESCHDKLLALELYLRVSATERGGPAPDG